MDILTNVMCPGALYSTGCTRVPSVSYIISTRHPCPSRRFMCLYTKLNYCLELFTNSYFPYLDYFRLRQSVPNSVFAVTFELKVLSVDKVVVSGSTHAILFTRTTITFTNNVVSLNYEHFARFELNAFRNKDKSSLLFRLPAQTAVSGC